MFLSLILHLLIAAYLTFGFTWFSKNKSNAQSLVVIDLVKISDKTNVIEKKLGVPKDDVNQKKSMPKPPPPPPPAPKENLVKVNKDIPKKITKNIKKSTRKVEILPTNINVKPKPKLKKNDINEKMVKLSMPTKRPERKSLRKISTSLPKNRPNKLIQNEINKKKRKVAATGVLQNLTEMTAAIDANEKKEEKKKKLNDKMLNNLQKMSALSKIGKVKKSDDQTISEKISISTIQAIQAHISKYYSPPPATRLRDNERVKLKIYLDREANVTKVEILETIRYNSDRAYRAVARSSRSAVLEASPLPYLPKNKYEKWKEIILNYSPR